MHPKAQDEFDRIAGQALDETFSMVVVVGILMFVGWKVGLWIASL